MKQGKDSYYVLVNKDQEVYTKEDYIIGIYTVFFNTWEDAEAELTHLLNTDKNFNKEDGWRVKMLKW